ALARIRAAAQAEFESRYRRPARTFTLRRIFLAAAAVLVVIIGALALRPTPPGAVVGSILRIERGAIESRTTLRVGDIFTATGTTLVRLDRGGTFRVAPGTRFEV